MINGFLFSLHSASKVDQMCLACEKKQRLEPRRISLQKAHSVDPLWSSQGSRWSSHGARNLGAFAQFQCKSWWNLPNCLGQFLTRAHPLQSYLVKSLHFGFQSQPTYHRPLLHCLSQTPSTPMRSQQSGRQRWSENSSCVYSAARCGKMSHHRSHKVGPGVPSEQSGGGLWAWEDWGRPAHQTR